MKTVFRDAEYRTVPRDVIMHVPEPARSGDGMGERITATV